MPSTSRTSHLILVLLTFLLLVACHPEPTLAPTPTLSPATLIPAPITPTGESQHRCGDGICDGPENAGNCPQDCTASAEEPTPVTSAHTARPGEEPGTYWVTNPTSGVELYTVVIYPPDWDGEPLPTLVIIPGGTDDSSAIVGGEILRLAHERGFAVVALDPDGRGRSGGEEGYSGFIQQDGLAAVVAFATELPGVDEERMGMLSFSYGVTLASGVLSRYPELPIRFYVDWEGPADRTDTGGCGGDTIGLLNPRAACDDELYWAEREALTFIAQIQVPYQRIQMENDHVQPDVSHAIRMVNAAVEGTSPWVRLNDYVPNQDYDLDAPPAMFPNRGDVSIGERLLDYAEELFEMTEASTSGAEV